MAGSLRCLGLVPWVAVRKSGGSWKVRIKRARRCPKLFEPFVEVDAFGIFPGGAGDEVEVAGEDVGIEVAEPVRSLGHNGLLRGSGRFLLGDFAGFRDPASFEAGPVDFLEIQETDAVHRFGELRAGRLEGPRTIDWRGRVCRLAVGKKL